MDDNDLMKAVEALSATIVAQTKAQSSLFVVLFSALVENGVLSAETVENQILTGLEMTYQALPESETETDRLADEFEANMALQMIGLIRRRLFAS